MDIKACLLVLLISGLLCTNHIQADVTVSEEDYTTMRKHMVKEQIKGRGINDARVLQAMSDVKRHLFVPEKYRKEAYNDYPLPIGENQTISQPYIVALMTQVLELDGKEKVLEIGTGSGYQAAVLGELAGTVYTIEIIDVLGKRATKAIKELEYDNAFVRVGDGYKGWHQHSPFDAIIVTCAPTKIPQPLVDQLAEGGKMVIPVGEAHKQKLVLLTKENGKVVEKDIIPVRFVPMKRENGSVY